MESIITIILSIVGIYLLLGLVFSILFLWKGISEVDSDTAGSSLFFKALIFPGICAFWILFLFKWVRRYRAKF